MTTAFRLAVLTLALAAHSAFAQNAVTVAAAKEDGAVVTSSGRGQISPHTSSCSKLRSASRRFKGSFLASLTWNNRVWPRKNGPSAGVE